MSPTVLDKTQVTAMDLSFTNTDTDDQFDSVLRFVKSAAAKYTHP